MKIKSVQSLAAGESQKYSADNNDAEIINLDDSSDESEVDVDDSKEDSVWISLTTETKSYEGPDSLSQCPDVSSVLSPGGCDLKIVDENTKDEETTSDSPPESSESENNEKLSDCPASPEIESEIESPESPNDNATGRLFDSPHSPDDENVQTLDSPESPVPEIPQSEVSSMKVRMVNDVCGQSLELRHAAANALSSFCAVSSSLDSNSRQATESAQYGEEEDWEAEAEPNPAFPEFNKTLDYAGILALRAQNKVDTTRCVNSGQATESSQSDNDCEAETEASPCLPVHRNATKAPCSFGARNDAAHNRPNERKLVGSFFGCYNCKGDHKCSDCPIPLNRALIKKRRQEDKRNQNQRYFNVGSRQSKYGQFKPGYSKQAVESASFMKMNGDASVVRQPQPQHQGSELNNRMLYPGLITQAPLGFMNYGNRCNTAFTNKLTLENIERNTKNFVNQSMHMLPKEVISSNEESWLPKKPVQPSTKFSRSCLGYDRPTPFFNPLPTQNTMETVVKIYNNLVVGKRISPSRDIVAEVERTGNYSYKISESLEQMEQCRRKAEKARKEKELTAPSPLRRKKRCRSPSLLDPFPDSEDSVDSIVPQNAVGSDKVPTASTSTVTSTTDDDDCRIIGVEPKPPKLPLATIVLDSDDDAQGKDSKPVLLRNPLYKKPKLMSAEQQEPVTAASSAKSKEWGDFLAEYNVTPENNVSQKLKVLEIPSLNPKTKTTLQSSHFGIGGFNKVSQVSPANVNELGENKLHNFTNAKFKPQNGLPSMDNSSRGPSRYQNTVVDSSGHLRLIRLEMPKEKNVNEATSKNVIGDDDDIQIIE